MHGDRNNGSAPRLMLTLGHGFAAAIVYLLGAASFGLPAEPVRRYALAIFAAVYFLRVAYSTWRLLSRGLGWGEAAIVLPWMAVLHGAFAAAGARNPAPAGWLFWCGAGLYVLGSYLQTSAEVQRRNWKRGHPGQLYTQGWFAYSRHAKYFGDTLLFTGYSLATGALWTLVLPAVMTAGFVFEHIPTLEKHLAQKYGDSFEEWKRRTPAFVPVPRLRPR